MSISYRQPPSDLQKISQGSYGKKKISERPSGQVENLPNIIRSATTKNIDLKNESQCFIQSKLLKDEQNDINFYKIQEIDKIHHKKNLKNYRSIHCLSDLALTRGCKLYEPKWLNEVEQRQRNQLKKQGQLLMLGEM